MTVLLDTSLVRTIINILIITRKTDSWLRMKVFTVRYPSVTSS